MPTSAGNPHPVTDGLTPTAKTTQGSTLTSTDWLLGALMPPLLIGLIGVRAIADGLIQVGLVSEQLLQGQRLPTLNIHFTKTD